MSKMDLDRLMELREKTVTEYYPRPLVIGPYDEIRGARGKWALLKGYTKEVREYVVAVDAALPELVEENKRLQRECDDARAEVERLHKALTKSTAFLGMEAEAKERHKLRAEVERQRHALRIVAGEKQCADNLLSNVAVAREALRDDR